MRLFPPDHEAGRAETMDYILEQCRASSERGQPISMMVGWCVVWAGGGGHTKYSM